MAYVQFDKALNIQEIHGTLRRNRDGSRLIARTSSRTGRISMHLMKPQQRATPLTDAEIASRQRFALICREVTRRIKAGDHRLKSVIWAEVKAALSDCTNV